MNRRLFLASIAAAVPALSFLKADASESELTSWPPASSHGLSMAAGVHYCERCDAHVFPDYDRISDDHVSVRFRDDRRDLRVILDGQDVGDETIEAMSGADGWVIALVGDSRTPEAVCSDCLNFVLELRYGNVVVIPKAS